jgi:glycosyltransferase involved in cell wall biosynthesis
MSAMVSVLLPVFNAEKFLRESIDSILGQTFRDFELLILNDGSTDGSDKIIKSYQDNRIRYFAHSNMGLSATLNKGLSLARGQFIARQDADDISHPERFEKQLKFFDNNPDCGLVGTWADVIKNSASSPGFLKHPTKPEDINFFLIYNNPFVHTSIMMRKCCVEQVGLYTSLRDRQPEDYELWLRFSKFFKMANIPELLVSYREVPTGISGTQEDFYPNVSFLGAEYLNQITNGVISFSDATKICLVMNGKIRLSSWADLFRLIKSLIICILFFKPSPKLGVVFLSRLFLLGRPK